MTDAGCNVPYGDEDVDDNDGDDGGYGDNIVDNDDGHDGDNNFNDKSRARHNI